MRSDLAPLLPAYSIGQRKQPAMSVRLFRRCGKHVAQIILVQLPYSSTLGKLRELHIQHRTLPRAATAGTAAGVPEEQPSIVPVHFHYASKKTGGPAPAPTLVILHALSITPSRRGSRPALSAPYAC